MSQRPDFLRVRNAVINGENEKVILPNILLYYFRI
ncbi:hypothetical protein MBGDN05_00327 [Thermoplasmatales archaeon SCGC AB-539-N05]|nr:hypothetical protein MBGDN05_00327 [Thermoplasmatales archaeon SCGC AB-539-N05]